MSGLKMDLVLSLTETGPTLVHSLVKRIMGLSVIARMTLSVNSMIKTFGVMKQKSTEISQLLGTEQFLLAPSPPSQQLINLRIRPLGELLVDCMTWALGSKNLWRWESNLIQQQQ